MKTFFSIFCFGFLFLLMSCKEDNEPIGFENRIFNFRLGSHPPYSWAIISDREGKILSYTRLQYDPVVLEAKTANLPEKVNVTLLNILDYPDLIYYGIDSYLDVKLGDTWHLATWKNNEIEIPQIVGYTSFQVNNYPGIYYKPYSASTILSGADSWATDFEENNKETLEVNVKLTKNPTNLLFSFHDFNVGPRYLNIPEARPDQTYNFDYNKDFKPADHVFSVSFPEYQAIHIMIQGVPEPLPLWKHTLSYVYDTPRAEFYLGYLDGYHYYDTDWDIKIQERNIKMKKVGDPPSKEDFQVLPLDFTVTNNKFSDFTYEYKGEFDYRKSEWKEEKILGNKTNRLKWTVYAPMSTDINRGLTKLPEEILQEYPYLENPDALQYVSTTLIDHLDGKDYENLLDKQFKINEDEASIYHTYSVSK